MILHNWVIFSKVGGEVTELMLVLVTVGLS